MAKPYRLPPDVATVLSRICCYCGTLPQGAPTSPVVSNMICARLDSELKQLAIAHRCKYSRYADDITFSTYLRRFPRSLAHFEEEQKGGNIRVGESLLHVIQSNGFEVNAKKIRLQHRSKRQEVTGLTSNIFPNVSRAYARQLRAMLHAWQKFGIDAAAEHFFTYYDYRVRHNASAETFRRVAKGKIDFLGLIKGKEDRSYLSALKKYAALSPGYSLPPQALAFEINLEVLRRAVWMIEGTATQGTAFQLHGVGLVTCAHVVEENKNLIAFRPGDHARYRVSVRKSDLDRDLAVLDFVDIPPAAPTFHPAQELPQVEDQVVLLGYPRVGPGNTGIVNRGAVIGKYVRFGQPRVQISCEIASGNSGGPVLDRTYRVIGVAANGNERLGIRGQELYGVVPISQLCEIVDEVQRP